MKLKATLFGLILLIAGAFQSANAALLYDESVSGDLSDDNLSPTALMALAAGSNVVSGGVLASPLDRDIFSITVGAGQQLVGIVLDTYVSGDDQSFFAVAAGNTIASLFDTTALLGNALIGAAPGAMPGDNILDDLGSGTFPGSTGFAGPLGPGAYTFWIQETTSGIRDYALDFQVRASAVPLPSSLALLAIAIVALREIRLGHRLPHRPRRYTHGAFEGPREGSL